MISVVNVSKSFAGARPRRVFDALSLSIAAGEFVAITGESGVGKSTLLNLVAGLERPDRGSIAIDGVELTSLSDDALTLLRRERIGFVFQSFHVLPYLSVAQNVALPLALNGRCDDAAMERVVAMLDAVGLADRRDSMPRELSGGELQRIAIARAVVHAPAIVLADEPTGNLDADNAEQVITLLRECAKSNRATTLLATHSPIAARAADRVLALTPHGIAPAGDAGE